MAIRSISGSAEKANRILPKTGWAYFGAEVQAHSRIRHYTVKIATDAPSKVLKKMGAARKTDRTVPIMSAKALRQINAFRKKSKIWLVRSPGVATSRTL